MLLDGMGFWLHDRSASGVAHLDLPRRQPGVHSAQRGDHRRGSTRFGPSECYILSGWTGNQAPSPYTPVAKCHAGWWGSEPMVGTVTKPDRKAFKQRVDKAVADESLRLALGRALPEFGRRRVNAFSDQDFASRRR